MPNYVAIHDFRLSGGLSQKPKLTITVTDEKKSLHTTFQRINGVAGESKVPGLFILCHGYAGENIRGKVSADAGGMGLELGKEDVTHSNVAMWSAIKNKVGFIVVYSCAAADTQAGNEGTAADGKYLMGALALAANCEVYAADKIQYYDTPNGRIDFGKWEGQLWMFPPDGSAPSPVVSAPVEIGNV